MAEHDFRYTLMNPQHTLTEVRALAPGRYQVTGNGGSIQANDVLLVTLKGSKDLSMRLTVDTVRHLLKPMGQWTAMTTGPVFGELAIHTWQVNCDSCAKELSFEFAVDAKLGVKAEKPAATARIAELGWTTVGEKHLCPKCQEAALMKRLALSALIGMSLMGCAAEPVQLQHNRSYILEWIGERPLMDYSHLTITLGDDGRAYGNGGCNHWFAPYTLEGHRLSFGKIGSTRKLCAPAVMEQETRFLQALEKVERWDISPIEQMRFWPAQGKPLRWWLEEG